MLHCLEIGDTIANNVTAVLGYRRLVHRGHRPAHPTAASNFIVPASLKNHNKWR